MFLECFMTAYALLLRRTAMRYLLYSECLLQDGDIEEKIMYNTFNMGIGMVLAVDSKDVDTVLAAVEKAGEKGYVIGQVEAGEKGVTLV